MTARRAGTPRAGGHRQHGEQAAIVERKARVLMRREGEHDPSAATGRNSTQSDIPCPAGPCPFTQPCYQLGEGRLHVGA